MLIQFRLHLAASTVSVGPRHQLSLKFRLHLISALSTVVIGQVTNLVRNQTLPLPLLESTHFLDNKKSWSALHMLRNYQDGSILKVVHQI